MKNETWKPIKGYEGFYEISNIGRVKSLERMWISWAGKKNDYKPETIRKEFYVRGYAQVALCVNGSFKHIKVHRMIATAFIPNPENNPQVNHKDGNKLNNSVENLEWCTSSENAKHAFKLGLRNSLTGSAHQNSKLVLNTETGIFYETATEAAKTFGHVKPITIKAMLCGLHPNRTSLIYV